MARIEDLIDGIADERIRRELRHEVAELKKRRQFGLVFERHAPETVLVPKAPIEVGDTVVDRRDPKNRPLEVLDRTGEVLRVSPIDPSRVGAPDEEQAHELALSDALIRKRFGEQIHPGLTSLGAIRRGGSKPHHVVIQGENYHALEMLALTNQSSVDVIYLDPPYNSGARDWTYNNDYVDDTDSYRHSKWLSFMERRLRLCRRLMKPEKSVLIVAIDEKEYLHLGMLLERMFSDCRIQMVSSLINPAGVARKGGFGRTDEYLFFVLMGDASPQRVKLSREWVPERGRTHTGNIRWDLLRRSGQGSKRSDSPGCFYAIYINPEGPTVAEVGDPLPRGVSTPADRPGLVALLPLRKDGSEGRWQWSSQTLRDRMRQGRVRVSASGSRYVMYMLADGEYAKVQRGEFNASGQRADGSLLVDDIDTEEVLAVPSTQWRISSHDATQYGSRLLDCFVGGHPFTFPKSLYAVADAIRFFADDNPEAVVLDAFGGSGTTTHALMLLNSQDGGRRRSVLITNNEVGADQASALHRQGLFRGDEDFEKCGIFQAATRPRIEAAVAGITAAGQPVRGQYLSGRPYAEGLDENVEFFRLDYLDRTAIELGEELDRVESLLWLSAGAKGERKGVDRSRDWAIADDGPYALLFKPAGLKGLVDALGSRPDVTHVFVFTPSDEAFAEISEQLPANLTVRMLYRDYLAPSTHHREDAR